VISFNNEKYFVR